jgi:dienelactone hydrolase
VRRPRAFVALAALGVVAGLLAPPGAGAAPVTRPRTESPVENPAPEFAVGRRELTFVDPSRPTDPNREYQGAPDRTLPVLVLYPAVGTPGGLSEANARPARRAGPYPLIVFSHGFTASGPAYGEVLLRRIAAHGYVVAAPTFPLSNRNAPGGPRLLDYVNQPEDVSFVIDRMLATNRRPGPLHGLVQRTEIGAIGHSLGGITTLGVTYNSEFRDRRIKAAVPMSGVQFKFGNGEWTWPPVPLLLVHGELDTVVPYRGSTRAYDAAQPPKFLLTLLDGPHTPFGAPYLDQIVRTVSNFLDRYLKHERRALARLEAEGTVPGVSTLQSEPRAKRQAPR